MYIGIYDNNMVFGWYCNEIDDVICEYMVCYINCKEYEIVLYVMFCIVFLLVSFMVIVIM